MRLPWRETALILAAYGGRAASIWLLLAALVQSRYAAGGCRGVRMPGGRGQEMPSSSISKMSVEPPGMPGWLKRP